LLSDFNSNEMQTTNNNEMNEMNENIEMNEKDSFFKDLGNSNLTNLKKSGTEVIN